MLKFHKIEEALVDIRDGKIVIVLDDEDRENEGDFVMAADKCTPEAINFMITHGRGMVCAPITTERARQLDLPPMVQNNDSIHKTAFTVTIDCVYGGSGISAQDRNLTIKFLTEDNCLPSDFIRPGHIFPLIAKDGGVLCRAGHTEASVDLARLAGCKPVGVICEILNTDGTMARTAQLFEIAERFNLKILTIKDLIEYRNKIK